MSKAFYPPDTLSKDDIRTIGNVRRDIWTNGLYGLFYGSITGITLNTITYYADQYHIYKLPKPLSRNTAFLSFMLGGAIGRISWR
jgi:hypothetical protein